MNRLHLLYILLSIIFIIIIIIIVLVLSLNVFKNNCKTDDDNNIQILKNDKLPEPQCIYNVLKKNLDCNQLNQLFKENQYCEEGCQTVYERFDKCIYQPLISMGLNDNQLNSIRNELIESPPLGCGINDERAGPF
jgi:hypothetical protein